jgi:periplasmic protein TonB
MELKKKPEADLTKKSGLFFNIGLIVSLGLIITAFEWKTYDNKDEKITVTQDVFEETQDIPLTEQLPPPPPQMQQPEIIEVPDEEEIEDDIDINMNVDLDQTAPVQEVVINNNTAPVEEEEEIFLIVEDQPAPNGGPDAWRKYLEKNLKYPEQAQRMNIEGKVYVQFVVDKDGKITDVTVLKGVGAGLDEEAVRVLKNAPAWKPGKQRGRPVRVKMSLPIVFKLS